MSRIKYSKELLEPIVKSSFSIQEVMRKLNLKLSGGTNSHLKSKFIKYNLDTSHFLGCRVNSGKNHVGGFPRIVPEKFFVYNRLNGQREHTYNIRRMLLEVGIKEECKLCGLGKLWNNKDIVLQIDHIDGNGLNNKIENLRFLCPNCHSQTDNFGSKNIQN